MHHLVEWQGDTLMVGWFGGALEPSATWNGKRIHFEGLEEDYFRSYPEKPEAAVALSGIIQWQNNG